MSGWLDDDHEEVMAAGFGLSQEDPRSAQASHWEDVTDEPSEDWAAPATEALNQWDEQDSAALQWRPELGFTDLTNAIRIWADEDGNLADVRVSLSWKQKIGDGSLERAFNLTFGQMRAFYRSPRADSLIPEEKSVPTTRQMSWAALHEHNQLAAELLARLDELPPGPNQQVEGNIVSATDFEDAVELWLDIYGYVDRVQFDEVWLEEEARSSSISKAILNCYRWAREDWRPPVVTLTERGELLEEHSRLRRELFAMMANGIER